MLTLPKKYDTLIAAFAPIFGRRSWPQVQVLIVGAILAPGKRTVTSALQIMGMSDEVHLRIITVCSIGASGPVWRSVGCCWDCW